MCQVQKIQALHWRTNTSNHHCCMGKSVATLVMPWNQFFNAKQEFLEAAQRTNPEWLKKLACEFVINLPSASNIRGSLGKANRNSSECAVQSPWRLDSTSLRTYLYEEMAIINSRPWTGHLLNDPAGHQPLMPNHILMMKSCTILPPPGEFVKEDLYLTKNGRRYNIWPLSSGLDEKRSTS